MEEVMAEKKEEIVVSVRMRKVISSLIDKERRKYSMPRSTWIVQTIVEKLEKLGYEIEDEK